MFGMRNLRLRIPFHLTSFSHLNNHKPSIRLLHTQTSPVSPSIHSTHKSGIDGRKKEITFSDLGVIPSLVKGLESLEIQTPNNVQQEFVPRLLKKENLVISASTGSGKTLAYCLPIIQNLIHEEENGYERQNHRPRCLILVPTRELATQILSTIKNLSYHCKIASCGVLGGESQQKQIKNLNQKVDIVVASPGRLLKLIAQRHISLTDVRYLVIDEVDTMLTQGFGADLRKIITASTSRSTITTDSPIQLIMASATITKAVRSLLDDAAGGFSVDSFSKKEMNESTRTVKGSKESLLAMKQLSDEISRMPTPQGINMSVVDIDGVNRSLPNVRHVMEDTKGADKLKTLEEVVVTHHNKKWKTMIFCNTITSCRAAAWYIDSLQLPDKISNSYQPIVSLSYHGELNSEDRKINLDLFRNDPTKQYLVCTDIAARGIDIPSIQHIIMFDFPLNPIDYIHRTGRTGRMGATGLVTSILMKRDRVLAKAIQNAIATGQRLDLLSSDKRDRQNFQSNESDNGATMRAIPKSRSNARIVCDPDRPGILVKQSPKKMISRTSKIIKKSEIKQRNEKEWRENKLKMMKSMKKKKEREREKEKGRDYDKDDKIDQNWGQKTPKTRVKRANSGDK